MFCCSGISATRGNSRLSLLTFHFLREDQLRWNLAKALSLHNMCGVPMRNKKREISFKRRFSRCDGWQSHAIPARGRLRQKGSRFKDSLGYFVSSKLAQETYPDFVFKKCYFGPGYGGTPLIPAR